MTDVNDCPPVFSSTYKYNFVLRENYYEYEKLLNTFYVDDADGTRENKELRYSIPGNDHAKGFVVDPVTGELSLNDTTLDHERLSVHTFKVRATNIGESIFAIKCIVPPSSRDHAVNFVLIMISVFCQPIHIFMVKRR